MGGVDLVNVSRLNLLKLAPGGHLGRFVLWTQDAFERLEDLYGSTTKEAVEKKGYHVPNNMMTNTDLGRIINSTEVQSGLHRIAIHVCCARTHRTTPSHSVACQ